MKQFQSPHEARRAGAAMTFTPRRGLSESLEQYAARQGTTPDEARWLWRILGLERLFPRDAHAGIHAVKDGPRIAPGVSVPTRHVGWWP